MDEQHRRSELMGEAGVAIHGLCVEALARAEKLTGPGVSGDIEVTKTAPVKNLTLRVTRPHPIRSFRALLNSETGLIEWIHETTDVYGSRRSGSMDVDALDLELLRGELLLLVP